VSAPVTFRKEKYCVNCGFLQTYLSGPGYKFAEGVKKAAESDIDATLDAKPDQ
jgi:hypothetical protein